MYKIGEIDFSSLMKAFSKLKSFKQNLNTDQEKAGAIQSFHYCFELSWKTMKKVVEKSGQECYYQKDIFREAANAKLIDSPNDWFKFINLRNLTVHTYNEENAEEVISHIEEFYSLLNKFIQNLIALSYDKNREI